MSASILRESTYRLIPSTKSNISQKPIKTGITITAQSKSAIKKSKRTGYPFNAIVIQGMVNKKVIIRDVDNERFELKIPINYKPITRYHLILKTNLLAIKIYVLPRKWTKRSLIINMTYHPQLFQQYQLEGYQLRHNSDLWLILIPMQLSKEAKVKIG